MHALQQRIPLIGLIACVTTGTGGDIVLSKAREVPDLEFPEIALTIAVHGGRKDPSRGLGRGRRSLSKNQEMIL